MPITDLFKLHDPSLMDKYNEKPYDARKDRAAFKKSLDAALDQLENGRTKVPNRMWSIANDVVRFEPKFKGRPVEMSGETVFTFHKEHFAEAMQIIKASVDAGELDEALEGSEGGASSTTSAPAGTATKSKRGTGIGNVAKPDDEQWMALFREWAGEPDPSIVDPVPNSSATKWVPKAFAERGKRAKATTSKKK